jgi:CheY-like chemotaxis protein
LLAAKADPPDAILTDFVMPTMHAHVFVKRLREEPALSAVPVILISSRGESVLRYFEERCGEVHVLTKPLEPAALVRLLDGIFQRPAEEPEEPEEPRAQAAPVEPPAPEAPRVETLEERIDLLFRAHVLHGLPALLRSSLHDGLREAGLLGHDDFTFAGSLERLSLADLLTFLSGSGQTGRLVLVAPHAVGEVQLERGLFAGAVISRPRCDDLLEALLRAGGSVDPEELDRALDGARRTKRALGDVLLERGLLAAGELDRRLEVLALEAFNALLELDAGRFHFESDELPLRIPASSPRIRMVKVLMDGLHVLDEKHRAHARLQEALLVERVPAGGEEAKPFEPTELERLLLERVGVGATLGELIERSPLTALATKRVYDRLARAGLVRLSASGALGEAA